jgi:TolB-like protein
MKNNQLINSIEKTLNSIINIINSDINEFNIDLWKKEKSKQSSSVLSRKLGLNDSLYNEFETALYQFEQYKDDPKKSKIACFRISLWLETVCKKLNLPFSIEESISNEQLAIKQVRALELLIRDVVNENLGGSQNVLLKLQELFKQDIVDKWIKSADETGVLSGTTFSELSNIFLDKDIFKTIEELVENSNLKLSKSNRDSLRYILEDIRLIRNSIAHNKKISNVQIDALNAYYLEIANLITESKSNTINPEAYLDLDMANLEEFLSSLKQDNRTIGTNIEEIKTDLKEVKSNTSAIHRKTYFIIGGIISIIFIAGIILYFVSKQSGSTDKLSHDIQDVKSIVSGDNELKNMTSTDDLSATKELNNRTKDVNAKRLAIIYFDNSGGEPSMDKLKKGLADMLITDLSNIHMLDIVERDKLESILKEQKLSNSKDFDPSTAAKVGKLLGAQIILTGGYFDMMGSLRIDARFIDVLT